MLSKKKKIFVLVGMIALLVVTGALNIFLNSRLTKANAGGTTTYGNFFVSSRTERKTLRAETMMYLDAIIENEATSAAAKTDAEAQKLALTKNMETEQSLETLIKALGFEDAYVISSVENVNIMIKSDELTANEVAKVYDIVTRETSKKAQNISVIPMK